MRFLDQMRAHSDEPLAVSPDFFSSFAFMGNHESGLVDQDAWYAKLEARMDSAGFERTKTRGLFTIGSIGVIPVSGAISQKYHWLMDYFGGTSTEVIVNALIAATNDESISSTVLDMSSPGGSVSGVTEAAAAIRKLRDIKQIHAIANPLAASAAYAIASSASKVYATASAQVGSVGVIATHFSHQKQLEDEGVEVTMITAGKHKSEGNPYEPLSDEAKKDMQAKVDKFYDIFVSDVSKGRGVGKDVVKASYGQGRVLTSDKAKSAGMIDGVLTMGELIQSLTPKKKASNNANRVRVASL